jgi:hypothetical protein
MIYPTLNKVGSGQRLSVELVNGLIKRTEYAADLLRQYKLIEGDEIDLNSLYGGTTISASANSNAVKYRGYIMPTVPSENDILLEEDVEYDFDQIGGEIGGLLAADLPLNQRQKIVYPDYVLAGGYQLRYSGAYWANFDTQPSTTIGTYGIYTGVLSGPGYPNTGKFTLGGDNGFPAFGPHPNAPRFGIPGEESVSYFFGGVLILKKI